VSLLAMAVCQPTNFLLAALNSNVGASLLAKAARQPTCFLQMYSFQL
jgi:hypothetical protein